MIVIDSPRSRRRAAAEAALQRLAGSGVDLRASASVLARDLAAGPIAGSRVVAGEVTLAMQQAGRAVALADDDLRVINDRHSSEALAAEDVVVFQDFAANDRRLDAPPIRFTPAALRRFALHAEAGRSVKLDHGRDIIGATFAADVVEETVRDIAALWLRIRWYAVLNDQTSAERRQHVQDCRTGVRRFGSIGMFGGVWDFQEVEGPDGYEYFYEIDDDETLTLREYSRVDLGAIAGAGDHLFRAPGAPSPIPTPAPSGARPPALCVLS